MPIYLDCAATSPLSAEVREEMLFYLDVEFGNAGSRTHAFGANAKRRIQQARSEVAAVVHAEPNEVIFTSGATESNNLAILGLAASLQASGRTHIISTAIEHKAVLEPVDQLDRRGFDVEFVHPDATGVVNPSDITRLIRPTTGLVSVMHVNNETGMIQPVDDIADDLDGTKAYLHVDAAQGFAKDIDALSHPRIDAISISAHKICGPKGVGALIARRRSRERLPIAPLQFGGGQEGGLRPGTQPVHLIAGLGAASRTALAERPARIEACLAIREQIISTLAPLDPIINGAVSGCVPNILNLSIPGVDSEALIVATRDIWAIATGSACTSTTFSSSYVLSEMGVGDTRASESIRLSWSHMTPSPTLDEIVTRASAMRRSR